MTEEIVHSSSSKCCVLHSESNNVFNIFCESCLEFICQECTVSVHHGHKYRLDDSCAPLTGTAAANIDEQHVCIKEVLSPHNSYTGGNTVLEARVDEKGFIVVKIPDTKTWNSGKPPTLTSELVHCKSKANESCEMEKQGDGQYVITYQPNKRGKHWLHVNINGREVKGSPYTITVMPSPHSIGKPIRIYTDFSKPNFITTNSESQIIVVENLANCVSVLDPEGTTRIRSFYGQDSNNGLLLCPTGVAVDDLDNIYVVDNHNHRIQKFSSNGTFVKAAGVPGNDDLCFRSPMGICFHPSNQKLYVCDQGNHRIQVLSTDLTFHSTFGSEGSGNGDLKYPRSITCNNEGQIYVTDCSNHRVQIFNQNGSFLQVLESKGDGDKLQYPYGIAIDSTNTVFVSERYRHCISVFTCKGEYITTFGVEGEEEGQFIYPNGLCIDQYDNLLVCDMTNCRIQVF